MILFLLLNLNFCFSQSDILQLNKKAFENYKNGNQEESILYYDSIYAYNPSYFNNFFVPFTHALGGDKKALNLIKVYGNSNLRSSQIIKPIASYLRIKSTRDRELIKEYAIQLFEQIKQQNDTTYFSGLCYTASFFNIRKKIEISDEVQIIWLEHLITLNNNTSEFNFNEVSGLKKYIDFILQYEMYLKKKRTEKDIIEIECTPDLIDNLENFQLLDYEKEFATYFEIKKPLIEGEINKRSLEYGVQLVNCYPTLKNLSWLKKNYSIKEKSFTDFWYENTLKTWGKFPINDKIKSYIDSLSDTLDWVVLDVWATWCVPCVEELPKFVKMNETFKKYPDKHLKFMTFSFYSKNLSEFMSLKKYTFPVLEINHEDAKLLSLVSYPTTFLISPTRKYMQLPFSMDKEEMIKVLSLNNW